MAYVPSSRIPFELGKPARNVVVEFVTDLESPVFRGPDTCVQRGLAGEFYLFNMADKLLKAYGADGKFARQIGSSGTGPGQYQMLRNILTAADGTVSVVDAALGRYSTYSASGEFLESIQIGVGGGLGMHAALSADGELILNTVARQIDDIASVVRHIDRQGVSSFLPGAVSRSPLSQLQKRLLWVRSNGELLVARPFAFTIDVYSVEFIHSRTIELSGPWVPSAEPENPQLDGLFDKPYTPRLSGMWEDESGFIWLQTSVPSPLWEPVQQPDDTRTLDDATLETLRQRPHIDSILEVLDLSSDRIIARFRNDGPIGGAFGGGYFLATGRFDGSPGASVSHAYLES